MKYIPIMSFLFQAFGSILPDNDSFIIQRENVYQLTTCSFWMSKYMTKKIKIINELVIWLILFPPRGSILCSYHCRVYGPIQSSLPLLKSLWYWPLSHTSGDGISTMTQMKGRKRKRKDKIERTFLSQSFFLKLYFAKLLSYWSSLIW